MTARHTDTTPAPLYTSAEEVFLDLYNGLARQGPGSETTTRRLLALAGPLPEHPRVLDLGCGTGPAALLLAAEASAQVIAMDLHQPFLDELAAVAAARRITSITTMRLSMDHLPFPNRSFDLVWAEGSVYNIEFDTALASWRRLLAPGGALVVTECEWTTDTPSATARTFWDRHYPLRTRARNVAAAEAAGYTVEGVYELPDDDWFDDYYTPVVERVATAPAGRGMAEAVAATREEITLRRDHGGDYRYTGSVLRPVTGSPKTHTHEEPYPAMTNRIWHTRLEAGLDDRAAIRRINLSAFPGPLEADLVDALREDRQAWLPWSSWLAEDPNGTPAGFALLTRCHVDDVPALALGPCAVLPEQQRTGAGSAAIRAALDAARAAGENLVLVLGHAPYYPRFGFTPASRYGIRPPFDVPDENMMALVLNPGRPVPRGTIRYAAAFGV